MQTSLLTASPAASTVTETLTISEGRLYTRVFASILDSSINLQSVPTSVRWLWITMLLIADGNRAGVVDMPVERLAARAGLSLDQTREGLAVLSAPDIESTSDEEQGRRIVSIREDSSRGWRLVNWEKYRALAREEQRREQTRLRVAAFREKSSVSNAAVTTANASEAAAATTATERSLPQQSSGRRKPDSVDVAFEQLWERYPRKLGKADASRHFRKEARDRPLAELASEIFCAIRNYRRDVEIVPREHMHGSRFFNGLWKDFADGTWTEPSPPRVFGQRTTSPAPQKPDYKPL